MALASYKKYLLFVLLILVAFNYLERHAFGLLLQDIKQDLDLTDTQLGLLTGIAFALFYSCMGVPMARWADRGNRVTIISIAAGLSGVAVALCGLAGSFLQLMLIRVSAAVGEAGCIPPAHSLIADYFDRAERPRAVARFMLGAPLSAVLGYFLAGWLNELYGWRATFVILGIPGLALALLAWLTIEEPRRADDSIARSASQSASRAPSVQEVCHVLWHGRTFRHVLLAFAVGTFFSYGIFQWLPALFIRSYGLQTGELGTWFALITGVGGLLGTYWGGEWASRHAANDEQR